jgi:hypothetical protein
MKKLLTLFFVIFCLVIFCQDTFCQVYQLMPQYGYQANRMRFDSTLQIPTVCGVPTLKSNVTRLGAIAFDSCNNRFYTYNPKTATWSQVSGGGGSTDTTSLSTRIDLKLDSIKRRADSVFAYRNGTEVFQFRDSIRPIDTPTNVIMSVVNATGTTLTKGEVVYLFGATGNTASVKRANNKSDSTSSKTIGVVRRDIAAGATGTVTTQGQVEKLNLGAYNEGDILWLDSLDGQLTKNKPVAPYHAVFIGVVERANNGNGLMYIKPQNGVELDEIHDVQMGTLVNNQVLVYSDTQRVWKNRSVYSVVDTSSLSNRINTKLNASDTASLSNRINQRLLITDTSVFDRKLIPANSFLANNTAAAANSTATFFKDTSGTYTGTITWTGTTAPSGATNHSYRWTRIGKMVTLNIELVYATNGGAITALQIDLPSDCPAPAEPAGLTGASQNMYPVLIWTSSSTNVLLAAAHRGFLRNNAGNTGHDFLFNFTSHAPNTAHITITYWTN